MLIDQSIQRIRAFHRDRGLSVSALAKMAGMGESTVRHINRPDWSPTADTLRRLEAVIPADFTPTNQDAAA